MSYVIKADLKNNAGYWEGTLNKAHDWRLATNEALSFKSPQDAASFIRRADTQDIWSVLPSNCSPRIVGPNGGVYSFTGKKVQQ